MYLALAEVMQTSSFTLPIFHTTQVMRPVINEPEDAEKKTRKRVDVGREECSYKL